MNWMEAYGVYLLFGGLLVLGVIINVIFNRPGGSKKVQTGHGFVMSRRAEYAKVAAGRYSNNFNYRVTFQVGNQILDLYVSQEEFPQLKEGCTGTVTWQYENLVEFVPDGA